MTVIHGPYLRKDGRKHIVYYDTETHKRTTKSFPKHLMEIYLGRRLENWETVDHINGDFTDDRLENLQILSRADNIRKSTKNNKKKIVVICSECGKEITKFLAPVNMKRCLNAKFHFCSRKCGGIYGQKHYLNNSRENGTLC